MDRRSYRRPAVEMTGYKTYVTDLSQKGIAPSDFKSYADPARVNWPVTPPQSHDKDEVIPIPQTFTDENREQNVGKTHYNTPKRREQGLKNWRTLSEDGEEYGHPTKWDYNYPKRRQNVTSAVQIRKPSERQHKTRGEEKLDKDRYYRQNKQEILRKRKKHYRSEVKTDPDRDRYQRLYREYPKRYKRQKLSPYQTGAERTQAWRDEKKEIARRRGEKPSDVKSVKTAENWYTWTKKTEPPESSRSEGRSLRVPNLKDHPQKGLFTPERKPLPGPYGGPHKLYDPATSKVVPQQTDIRNHDQPVPEDVPNNYLRNWLLDRTASAVAVAWLYMREHGNV